MKNLIIIGAGGFGREVLSYALDMQDNCIVDWKVKGFIDDDLNALDNYNTLGYQVLNFISNYEIDVNDVFICAIADVKIKLDICYKFMNKGAVFINLIHPTAILGKTSIIGVGNIFCPFTVISQNITLGNFNIFNAYTSIGHDVLIKDGCTLSSHCDVTGGAILEEGTFLGSHAVICPKVKINKYARVGAGSVVIKKVKENTVVFGNPAKEIF